MSKIAVNTWHREEKMNREQIVRFQVLVYCHIENIILKRDDLNYLTVLAINNGIRLSEYCDILVGRGWFTTQASARNTVDDLEYRGLLNKQGANRKTLHIKPEIKVQTQGNILMEVKCLYRE